jgi:hypothetical protein
MITMRDKIEYIVRDPNDWQGEAWFYSSYHEAFDIWSENQDFHLYEICLAEGYVRDLTDDAGEEYARQCREARELKRHEASFAPSRATHGG